jgi:hypothetical protein
MQRRKMQQVWFYIHQNEKDRLEWLASQKSRNLSETLRGIIYTWLNENHVPYPRENENG